MSGIFLRVDRSLALWELLTSYEYRTKVAPQFKVEFISTKQAIHASNYTCHVHISKQFKPFGNKSMVKVNLYTECKVSTKKMQWKDDQVPSVD